MATWGKGQFPLNGKEAAGWWLLLLRSLVGENGCVLTESHRIQQTEGRTPKFGKNGDGKTTFLLMYLQPYPPLFLCQWEVAWIS